MLTDLRDKILLTNSKYIKITSDNKQSSIN